MRGEVKCTENVGGGVTLGVKYMAKMIHLAYIVDMIRQLYILLCDTMFCETQIIQLEIHNKCEIYKVGFP